MLRIIGIVVVVFIVGVLLLIFAAGALLGRAEMRGRDGL